MVRRSTVRQHLGRPFATHQIARCHVGAGLLAASLFLVVTGPAVAQDDGFGAAVAPAPAAPPPKDDRSTVLVLDPAAVDVPKSVVKILTGTISYELSEIPLFVVMTGEDVRRLSQFEAEKMLAGCDDDSCASEIADALGADLVVFSTVGKLGATYVIDMSLLDPSTAKSEGRISREARDIESLRSVVAKATRDLVTTYRRKKMRAKAAEVSADVHGKMAEVAKEMGGTSPSTETEAPTEPEVDLSPVLSIAWVASGVMLGATMFAVAAGFDLLSPTSWNNDFDFVDFVWPVGMVAGIGVGTLPFVYNPFTAPLNETDESGDETIETGTIETGTGDSGAAADDGKSPNDTTPAHTTPADATPADATPADATPAEADARPETPPGGDSLNDAPPRPEVSGRARPVTSPPARF